MRLLNHVVALAVLGLLAVAPGDRPAGSGRVAAGPAAASWSGPAAARPFVVFGWVSPPASITTDARIAEMREAGLNLTTSALRDSGRREDNLVRLDLAAAHGMRCLLLDARFERFYTLDPDSSAGGALLDSIVADYRGHPAFFGYSLGDEPPREEWPLIRKLSSQLRRRDPDHPAWNNLLGRSAFRDRLEWEGYVRDYLATMHPAVLCDDQYDFLIGGDRGHFVENAAGLAAIAREAGLPFWAFVLLVQHGPYRAVTPGELAWQVSMLLAYGTRGIGYFTYWTPPPDSVWNWQPAVISYEGRRTAWYPVVADLNRRVRPTGETLASLTWLATEHAGSVPTGATPFAPDGLIEAIEGRAALGHFVDSAGTRYALVANSDSLSPQRVTLALKGKHRVWRLGDRVRDWRALHVVPAAGRTPVTLDLEPGGFELLRFDGGFCPLGAGRGPRLEVSPRPAHREVSLAVSSLEAGGHVEILDASGRRVRSWRPGAADLVLRWHGESDAGGFVPPGIYFVRAEDTGGVAAARIEWLGRR